MSCTLQSDLTKHVIESASGGARHGDVETTRCSPLAVYETSKHAQLLSRVSGVNVLNRLCFAEREFTSRRRNPARVRSYPCKLRGRVERIPEPALRHRTVAAS